MKRFFPLILGISAVLYGCASPSNHAYWQARSNAIADLPAEQQAAARIELLRDWQQQKDARDQAIATAVIQASQQFGAEARANAAIQQQEAINGMQQCIQNISLNPALQYHPVPAPAPPVWQDTIYH
jgi:hypothetical protein